MPKVDRGSTPSRQRRNKLTTQRGLATAKTTVVVVVDGNIESAYFKKLETLQVFSNIRFKPKVGNETNYDIIFKEHFDVVHKYLILDIDCSDILNLKRAKKIKSIVERKDMRSVVYFNNYSFETFLLNHIRAFGQPIANKKDYDQHMKKHFGVSHWSTMKNTRNTNLIIDKITDETFDVMTKNIKQIYKKSCFENPNSNMHLLFAKIDKIK